ncbi:Sterigmatocystin biosynthesis regulatory protein [Cytospora mali]|uniref:Sterigmatocystin biosynthesis regulatory protein n=1 Tax=Cytospora mali TaxID=578113 RepID=A0A194VL57_CYTMA|nr:Sterigmatocystin biosynthesis regulatory protein [Valsa mali]
MTDLQASSQAPNTSSQRPQTTGGHRATGSTTSKLRYSCHACALSKVKCPKNKPRCSRCESRGIACEYFVSKRPGRKRDSRPQASGSKDDGSQDTITVVRPACLGGHGSWRDSSTNININSNTNPITNTNTNTNNGSTSTASESLSSGDGYLNPSVLIPSPPSQDNAMTGTGYPSSLDVLPGLWIPLEPGLSSAAGAMSSDYNDFFTSPIEFPELEGLAIKNTATKAHVDILKLLIPDETATTAESGSETSSMDRPGPSMPSSPSSDGQVLSTRGTSVRGGLESQDCSCLVQALLLMKTLSFSCNSSTAARSPPQGGTSSFFTTPIHPDEAGTVHSTDNGSSNNISSDTNGNNNNRSIISGSFSTAQSVVAENKATTEAVSTVLRCSCAKDGYLLVILSLVTFKLLGRYAAAAARRQAGDSKSGPGSYPRPVNHDGIVRMSAQLVLSELHRVQRLVNELSLRLKAQRAEGGPASSLGEGKGEGKGKGSSVVGARQFGGGRRGPGGVWEGEAMMAPFSAATLEQIEIDLRRRLGALSSEIINTLRQS